MTPGPVDIAVFGGSGFTSLGEDTTAVTLDTPYGPPSAPVTITTLADRRVAFLPRHGVDHRFPPHRINYRANLWALRELGVTRIFGPCASGSLQPGIAPGHFVVCDQLVDRTSGRPDTYFDGPTVNHVAFADPYCPELRRAAIEGCRAQDVVVHERGTVVVVQGPRFSTRAESRWYRSAGWEVINMTQHPEAYLARELGICYSAIALVTDYDTGVEDEPDVQPVSHAEVFAFMDRNVENVRRVLVEAVRRVPADRAGCTCADAPNGHSPEPPA